MSRGKHDLKLSLSDKTITPCFIERLSLKSG